MSKDPRGTTTTPSGRGAGEAMPGLGSFGQLAGLGVLTLLAFAGMAMALYAATPACRAPIKAVSALF